VSLKTSSRVPDVATLSNQDDASRLASTNPSGVLQMLTQFVRDRRSSANGLTAHAGGGQGSALALTSYINRVTTVGTAADSVLLPPAIAGEEVVVINAAAANSMNVFPTTGDAINALSANAAFAVASNKTAKFFCAVTGIWNVILTA
jgi:hypothetical protein